MTMTLLFAILIAFAVALAVAGVFLSRPSSAVRRLGDRLRRAAGREVPDLPTLQVERDDRYSTMPWFDRLLRNLNLGERLELLLYQAGMSMRAGMLIMLSGLLAAGGYLFGLMFFHRLFIGLVAMALLAPAPYFYVLFRKQQRMKAFAKEFPDALDLLVSAMRAGLSFTAAMQIVSEESPEPVAGEFAITVEEQALGLEVREVMLNLTRRVDVLDLKLFVTAILLQRETGGNLAEVLSNSAGLIRDRFRILGDIATFTAQGRMTAVILSALPIGVAIFTYAASPEYFKPMIESAGGRAALWFAGFMQFVGVLVIRKIVNVKV